MSIQIERCKDAADALRTWPRVSAWMERATKSSLTVLSILDMERSLARGSYDLWKIFRDGRLVAAMLTEVLSGAKDRGLNVVAIGGAAMTEWIDEIVAELRLFARAKKCSFVAEMGRLGWKKILGDRGWTEGPTTMIMRVS